MASKKTVLFGHLGNKEDVLKAFVKQSRAKDLYILRMTPEKVQPDPAGSDKKRMTWLIQYVTGREARALHEQFTTVRGRVDP